MTVHDIYTSFQPHRQFSLGIGLTTKHAAHVINRTVAFFSLRPGIRHRSEIIEREYLEIVKAAPVR